MMNEIERQIWLRLLKRALAKQSFGKPGRGPLCRFAGMARFDDGLGRQPFCMRCVLARYLYANHAELSKTYEELPKIFGPITEEGDMETALANQSLSNEYCEVLPTLTGEGTKKRATRPSPDQLRENIGVWCGRIIVWLEKEQGP
jgi:hypothetical protein